MGCWLWCMGKALLPVLEGCAPALLLPLPLLTAGMLTALEEQARCTSDATCHRITLFTGEQIINSESARQASKNREEES